MREPLGKVLILLFVGGLTWFIFWCVTLTKPQTYDNTLPEPPRKELEEYDKPHNTVKFKLIKSNK